MKTKEIDGVAIHVHCLGQPMTFDEAVDMFKDQPGTHHVYLCLDTRLVRLAPDRFAIQYKNTYVVRICLNGHYILNACGKMNVEIAKIFNDFTPVEIKQFGSTWGYTAPDRDGDSQFSEIYHDLDIVNSVGELVNHNKVENGGQVI